MNPEKQYEKLKEEWYRELARKNQRNMWFPLYKQWLMMSRTENEGFYGGAAGGGKTDYLVMEAMSQVEIPEYKGIIFRRTYPELNEVIDKCEQYYKAAYPKARYNGSTHCWRFPSGAKIYLGAMQHEKDKLKYQGQQFDFIGFDELTHFTMSQYEYLRSRNRGKSGKTVKYMRSTGNPGGVGHGWVKQYFVTPGMSGKPVYTHIKLLKPDGSMFTGTLSKIFVSSRVWDNEHMIRNNPTYIQNLATLNEQDKKALLDGDWDIFSGQTFTSFRDNPDGYESRRLTHVIPGFRVPEWWNIYRGFDWGYMRPFSCGWYACSPDGVMYRIQELYGCQRNAAGEAIPDTGVKWDPQTVARKIREIETNDPNLKGHKIIGIADPAIFADSMGANTSIAAMMAKEGIYFQPANHERIPGLLQCQYRLKFNEEGYPMFYVFDKCRDFIRTIPALVYDDTNVEDINTRQEDHIYDEWRYCMAARTISIPREKPKEVHEYDPLNQFAR